MAKGEAPRRRLITSDSEDEAPAAEPTFEDEPEVPDGEVNFPSVARRIRAPVPVPAEGEERPADAFAPSLAALNELRGVDMSDPASVEKLAEHGIVDAVLDLLRARPAPVPPGADGDGDGDPADAPPDADANKENAVAPTPEARKAAAEAEAIRAKYDAVSLPAARALAHLCGAPSPVRREMGKALLHVRVVFGLLDPDLASPSLVEAALRILASLAQGSTYAAETIARLCAGKDDAAPSGGAWFVDLFSHPARRVVGKVARLACLLSRAARNREVLFGDWTDDAGTSLLRDATSPTDVADVESTDVDAASPTGVRTEGVPDLLATIFATLRRATDAPIVRRLCVKLIGAACAEPGEPMVRVLDREEFDGPGVLMEMVYRDEDDDARVDAATTLLSLATRNASAAEDLGRRGAVRALRAMLPEVTEEPPELVVEGADADAEGADAVDDPEGADPEGADEAADETASERSTAISVSGHNVFTEAFGVRAVGYVSPPPKPTPMRVADDAFAAPERASDPRLFPLALRLAAAILENHAPSLRDAVDEHAWVVAYLDKVGNVDVKEPMDLTHEDLETWLAYLTRAMRDPAEAPEPEPAPAPELTPEPEPTPEEAEKKAAEAQRLAEDARLAEEATEAAEARRRLDYDLTDVSDVSDDESEPSEPEASPERVAAREDEARRVREARRARHEEDAKWHNADVRAAAMTVLQALSGDTAVCRSLISPVLHPSALPRVIASLPTTYATVEEGAHLLQRACEKGAHGDQLPMEMDEVFRDVGVVEQLRAIADELARNPPSLAARRVAVAAHETALMIFPNREYLPEIRKTPLSPRYSTTPPPPTPPAPTWRRRPTRNVDEETVRVLPLHSALPETWTARDPDTREPLVGARLERRMRRLVVGREEGEDLEEKDAADEKKTEKDVEEAEREAEAAAKALEMAEARSASAEEATPPPPTRLELEGLSEDERAAMLREYDKFEGARRRAREALHAARSAYAAKTLTASILSAVVRSEDGTKREEEDAKKAEEEEKRSDARDESDAWNLDAFRNAIAELAPKWEKTATMAPSDVPPPPPAAYAAIRFIATVLDGEDAAEKFRVTDDDDDDDAQEGEPAPETGTENADGSDPDVDRSAKRTLFPTTARARAEAAARRRVALEKRAWTDPEGPVAALLRAEEPDLAARMLAFVDDTLPDFDAEAMRRAEAGLERVYVADAARESEAAERLVKWCYCAARKVALREAKAARATARRAARAEAKAARARARAARAKGEETGGSQVVSA